MGKKKKTYSKSIKLRLLMGIIGMAVTISILFGLANGILLYLDSDSNSNHRLSENATAYSQAVSNAIEVYETKIQSIAMYTSITDQNKSVDERNEKMTQIAADNGFALLTVADVNGKTLDGADISQRDYFKRSMEGETCISTTVVNSRTKEPMLMISTKVNNGQFNGVLVGAIKAETFSEMVNGITIGKSGYAYILDHDGKVIAHKDINIVLNQINYIELAKTDKKNASIAEVNKHLIEGKTGVETNKQGGHFYTTAYTPIPGTDGWSIGIVAKKSDMMSSFYVSIGITIVMAFAFIFLSFLLSFKIAAPIVNPVVGLVKRIEALEKGDLHSEVPQVNSGDELEILSKSFARTVSTLNSYIHEITSILSSLEVGDCTVKTKLDFKGDFVQIQKSLNGIAMNLNSTFLKIKESSDQVAGGAGQISSASQALASGAAQQAATVEELTASIDSVSGQAEQNATNVQKARAFVEQAASGMNEGNEYMQKLEVSMKEIGEASQKISNITKVIEDIAFQTNILALNAAVESARAGEAGKGFAVVADEVRNLAAKSAEAAKQTADLIGHSVGTVASGERLADDTAKMLKQVADKSKLLEEVIQEIAMSSIEQVKSIEQINDALTQVSCVVQSNAATAEESSASSEELDSLAQTLKQEIEKLKLQETAVSITMEDEQEMEQEIEDVPLVEEFTPTNINFDNQDNKY